MTARAEHAEHFADAEKQAHAARLGMWIFLASELLLFAALFTLFAAYRARRFHPLRPDTHRRRPKSDWRSAAASPAEWLTRECSRSSNGTASRFIALPE